MERGLKGTFKSYTVKAMLAGVASIAFASALGRLEIKRLPVANFLPALALAPLWGHLSAKLPL